MSQSKENVDVGKPSNISRKMKLNVSGDHKRRPFEQLNSNEPRAKKKGDVRPHIAL
jgi:hypothetical protein